jgi:5'-deoxynucleotidase YfbR-like HD superfamily hydrolase
VKIETYTGTYFDYSAPRAEDVRVEDIARALSHVSRFGGHTSTFYCVAEHALLCRRLVLEAGHDPRIAFAALHHDSHEAYIGDVPTPLKVELGEVYEQLAERVDIAVAAALGLDAADFHHEAVREADALALRIEAAALKRSRGVGGAWTLGDNPPDPPDGWYPGMSSLEAERGFLRAHKAERAFLRAP